LDNNLLALCDSSELSEIQVASLRGLLQKFSPAGEGPMGLDVDEGLTGPLTMPNLKIKQRMTTDVGCPDEAHDGDLYITSGDLVESPLKCTPLYVWTSHIMWEPSGGRNIECQSPDGKMGSVYGACKECPNMPWRDGKKQACAKTLNAIIISENMDLTQTRFSGSSYTAGKNLVKFVRSLPEMWNKFYLLGTEKRKNDKGEFYIFDVRATTESPSGDFQKVAKHLCEQISDARKSMISDFYTRVEEGTAGTTEAENGEVKVTVINSEPSYDEDM